ncbi:hypothetical protein [Escherichia phage vB_EcoM_JNE01]|nr:hypothetical protein [Escherichia phage vB_EcoM_JNE01]
MHFCIQQDCHYYNKHYSTFFKSVSVLCDFFMKKYLVPALKTNA